MTSTCSVCAVVFDWMWSGAPICPGCRGAAAHRVALAALEPLIARLNELGSEPGRVIVVDEPDELSCEHVVRWCDPPAESVSLEPCAPCGFSPGVSLESEEEARERRARFGAAKALLGVDSTHSPEQLKRISEFGCSSLPSSDQPCGSCVDCTPEDDLKPPLFAVADLPGFDEVAARKLAELEIALDEGVREPASKPRPAPWLLPLMVVLYPISLIVALTISAEDRIRPALRFLRRVRWLCVAQWVLIAVAVATALMVLGFAAWAVWSFVAWLWSYIGWLTIPALALGAYIGDR